MGSAVSRAFSQSESVQAKAGASATTEPAFRMRVDWQPLQPQRLARAGDQRIFVDGAGFDARDEEFPDPGAEAAAHGVAGCVPAVEITDDRDMGGIGRPDGEEYAGDAVDLA